MKGGMKDQTLAACCLALSNCLSSILGKQVPEISVYMANEVLRYAPPPHASVGDMEAVR